MKKLIAILLLATLTFAVGSCGLMGANSRSISQSEEIPEGEGAAVENVVGLPVQEAIDLLNGLGFTNVKYNPINDWDISKTIVTSQNISAGTVCRYDKSIILICHKLCTVRFEIKSEFNLLFSKYDIDLLVDDQSIGRVSNGDTLVASLELLEGSHNLRAINAENDSVNGHKSLDVTGNMVFSCSLSHKSNSIDFNNSSVTQVTVDLKTEMPDVTGLVLADAENRLKEAGFTNITAEPEDTVRNRNHWMVQSQNIKSGEAVFKSDAIILTCISMDDYYSALFTGKPLDEVLSIAEEKGINVTDCRDQQTRRRIAADELSEKELMSWIVESAANDTLHENSVKLNVAYIEIQGTTRPEESTTEPTTEEPTEETTQEQSQEPSHTEEETEADPTEPKTEPISEGEKTSEPSTEAVEENPYVKIDRFSVSAIRDWSHIRDSDYLGYGEGLTISISTSQKDVTKDDFIILYDEELVVCEEMPSESYSDDQWFRYRITGKKAGQFDVTVLTVYDYYEYLVSEIEPDQVYSYSVTQLNAERGRKVYCTPTGTHYHYSSSCAGDNADPIPLAEAKGYLDPCGKCAY